MEKFKTATADFIRPGVSAAISRRFEDVLLRHKSFGRAANPEERALLSVLPIVKTVAKKSFRTHPVWASMGYEREDLVSLGLVHSVPFLHEHPQFDTGLLVHYLRQRFNEMARINWRKLRCCSLEIIEDPQEETSFDKRELLHRLDAMEPRERFAVLMDSAKGDQELRRAAVKLCRRRYHWDPEIQKPVPKKKPLSAQKKKQLRSALVANSDPTRTCSRCHEPKDISEFNIAIVNENPPRARWLSYCRDCRRQ